MGWLKSADSPAGDDEAEVRAWLRVVIAWIGDTAVLRPPEAAPQVAADPTAPADGRPAEPVRLAIVAA